MTEDNVTEAMITAANEDSADKEARFSFDGFWKDLIEKYTYPLLKRAVPEFYKKANTKEKPRLLDKEFRDILNTGDPEIYASPRFADFVLEVPLKSGAEEWVLLHIEAEQGSGGGNLAERMNHYRCLIYAHYRREPVALAIIASGQRKKERFYSHSRFGTEIIYRYNYIVVANLDVRELKASDNPIDLALYAAKCALKAKKELQKYNYLRALTDILAERGWDKNEKRDLVNFITRIINLKDKTLQDQYWEYRQQLYKEGKIVYESFLKEVEERMIERRTTEKCKEEIVKNLLTKGISTEIIAESVGVPIERVRTLAN